MKKKIIGLSIGIIISLTILIIISMLIKNSGGAPLGIDSSVRDFFYNIRGNKNGFGFYFFRIITECGNVYFTIGTIILILILTKGNNKSLMYILGILLMILINYVMKDIYQRDRPYLEYRWMFEKDTSYPSGHSTTVGFMVPFFIYFFYDSNYKKVIKIIAYIISGLIIVLVPISRLFLGMHYITDVIAGLASGIIVSLLMIIATLILKKLEIYEKPIFDSVIEYFKKDKDEEDE